MVFSSLLFIFAFLTPQILLCLIVRNRTAQNWILLIFSLVFYAFGGPKYLLLLLFESFVSYFTAIRIESSETKSRKKVWLIVDIFILVGLLIVFKYLTFFLSNIQLLTGIPKEVPEIVLPIGISFYTFQLISYTVDVYRGDIPAQKRYYKILLYASLFHQCIAGPIVRYQTIAEEIDHRTISVTELSKGIRRFSVGLAKKAILANGCASIADTFLPSATLLMKDTSQGGLWLGMIAYMLQIYLDFSAYSDMAIGMGQMMGFHYLENFDYPYYAASIRDFWRRWHISLSTFFRDYIYIPLGGNKKGMLRTILNMGIVWALTGIWHGASWNYLLWGLYFFIFLTIERLFLGKFLEKNYLTHTIGHIYTLAVVLFGWVLFRFTDFSMMKDVLLGLFGQGTLGGSSLVVSSALRKNFFFLLFAIVSVFPVGKTIRNLTKRSQLYRKHSFFANLVLTLENITPIVLLILSVMALTGDTYNPFLYFQF